jgi:pyruvate/2-oxoacid:ferredoxin oxidoreductase alpha subunit
MSQRKVMQGNMIVAKAALAAGCDFFAGYPITPSSEVAQYMSREMPKMDRVFIQMEDEIASLGACIGASLAGRKTMTATSGPGFSLMQEHIGMAVMAEVPVVIVNVMRGGPSTGAGRHDAGALGHPRRPSDHRCLPGFFRGNFQRNGTGFQPGRKILESGDPAPG